MNSPRSGPGLWSGAATVAPLIALFVLTCGPLPARAQQFTAGAGWRDVSDAEYRQHLAALDALVAACQKQTFLALGAAQKA